METIERDYAPKGVKFYYIYKSLAHPETNGYVAPFSLQERLMHVAEAKRTLGSRIPWICDTMDNDLKHALGDRPNSEFVIDPTGEIIVSRQWSNPTELRADLARLVGKVEHPTRIAELDMKTLPPPAKAKTGIVARVSMPGKMSPLRITPLESKLPHYAKLRAESGAGTIYLGFFLDPLYKVHWNNRAPAIEFSIEPPQGVTVTPDHGKGPKVVEAADADPREFLIKVSGQSSDPMKVVVKYFACDDAETFCVPVTQEYLVSFQRDRDGGTRRSPRGGDRSRRRPGERMTEMTNRNPVLAALDLNGDGELTDDELDEAPNSLRKLDRDGDGELTAPEILPGSGGGPFSRSRLDQDRERMIRQMFERSDRNRDGKLVGSEIPQPMRIRMQRFDANNDGIITRAELRTMDSSQGQRRRIRE